MKKLLIVALGLGLAGQAQAKLNLTAESGTGLITAVENLPENILKIQKNVVCNIPTECTRDEITYNKKENKVPRSLEATGQALKAQSLNLASYSKKDLKGKSKKYVAQYKLVTINAMITLIVNFLQLTLDTLYIIKGVENEEKPSGILPPILKVIGQQSLKAPLDKMTTSIKDVKTILEGIGSQMSDIFDLVAMMDSELLAAQEASSQAAPASGKR